MLARLARHLLMPSWRVRQRFPASALSTIESAIRNAEQRHDGQICFAVEAALDVLPLLRGLSARERALEVFARLRVWDTERNNGVLIYLLLADHDVEILADRGIHRPVGREGWEQICQRMEAGFRAGRFPEAVIEGIEQVSRHLARHFPRNGPHANEISDRPIIL